MNLDNIHTIESLIKERNMIIRFRDDTYENSQERELYVNYVKFESVFLHHIHSQAFVNNVNDMIQKMCNDYISKIDAELELL